MPRLRSLGNKGPTVHLRTTDTAAVTYFVNILLQFPVHVLGLEEVLPGRVQVLLQLCHMGKEGCQALLHLALLLLVYDFLEVDHLSQVLLVA